jgi:uncharacterized membrane protein YtjA (UPF0391 family)
MLGLAVVLLLIALLAYFLGAGAVGGVAMELAKWCFILFVVLLVLSFVFSAVAPGPYWHWPMRW